MCAAAITVTTVDRTIEEFVGSTANWASTGESIPGFKDGVTLYPHQGTVIQSLVDTEDARVLTVPIHPFEKFTDGPAFVESSACVLSEPFGSGKTIALLGLILLRPIPTRMRPIHVNVPVDWRRGARQKGRFSHEIVRMYTGQALMRPTLIVVGAAVLVQWQQAIEQFTHLRALVVGNHHDLMQFRAYFQDQTLGRYDIVLMKAGKITGALGDGKKNYRSTISAMAEVTAGSTWARVIYDDFDTVDINAAQVALDALFTIYVSASKARPDTGPRMRVKQYVDISEAIMELGVPLRRVVTDAPLYGAFNVCNDPDYTRRSMHMPKIEVYRYVYLNPDDTYMDLLGVMGDEDAVRIMEMLNGDAIATAADAMGIKTSSVANIFQRVLDKKYERFLHDTKVLNAIEWTRVEQGKLQNRPHNAEEINAIEATLTKGNRPQLTATSGALIRMLADVAADFTIRKEEDGRAIERVISNVKEGECQICRLPLAEFDVFIIKCCGLIVCDDCGIKGSRIQRGFDYKTKSNTLHGTCANCRATIYPQTDLIYLEQGFDIESIITAAAEQVEPEIKAPIKHIDDDVEPTIRNPKLRALLAIVNGDRADEQESVPCNIMRLVNGDQDIPGVGPRKVLVFAGWDETLKLVEDFLVENDIEFLRLGGTYQEKAATIEAFRVRGRVLLVNSQQTCAGINAQFATDLVFMHKINNRDIEAQVAGRLQRIGRTCNARIHYLCYKNESSRV